MKQFVRLSFLSIAVPALLAACASTPKAPPPAPVAAAAPAPMAAPAPAPAPAPASTPPTMLPAYLDPTSDVYKMRSIYFDFDQSVIRDHDKAAVEVQGKYLAMNPSIKVRVEGNTDERGGAEYNLALGQRRSEAVQKALQVFGVKDGQTEPVSFGKERPKNPGHDEAAWAENRRVDVVYPK